MSIALYSIPSRKEMLVLLVYRIPLYTNMFSDNTKKMNAEYILCGNVTLKMLMKP